MSHDVLAQLLKSVDAASPAPNVPDDLPTRVRRRLVHRRHVRAITGVTAVALLVATVTFLPHPGTPGRGQGRGASHAAHLAALDREAALHEQTAALLLTSRRVPSSPSIVPAPADSVLSEIRQQRDRAALILVYEADRARDEKRPDRALAAYRRTIELFPTTYWAGVARQRLKEMST